jgi:hypothetical protein
MVAVGGALAAMGVMQSADRARRHAILRGFGVFLTAAALAFLAGTPFALLDAPHFIEGLQFDSSHLMGGHGVELGRGWSYHLMFSRWYGLGPPLLIAGVVGMFLLAVRSWRKAVLLCTFPVLYYVLVGRGLTVFVRYVTPLVPFLCVTAAVAVAEVARRIAAGSARGVSAVAATAALLLAVPSLERSAAFDRLIVQTDTRILAKAWLDEHAKPSDWIAEEQPALLHSNFASPVGLRLAQFNPAARTFVNMQGETVRPDWVVLPRTPLASYMQQAGELFPLMRPDYTLVAVFVAGTGIESGGMFDEQDMFAIPYTDFSQRDRPGPDVYIFQRTSREP